MSKATYGSIYGFGTVPQGYVKQAVEQLMEKKGITDDGMEEWNEHEIEMFGIEVRYAANVLEQTAIWHSSMPYILGSILWELIKRAYRTLGKGERHDKRTNANNKRNPNQSTADE